MELTLFNLFQSQKEALCAELSALKFPHDVGKFESIIQKVFVEDVKIDEYKKSLTNQEIAILNSALALIDLPELLSRALHKEYKQPAHKIYVNESDVNGLSKYLSDPVGRGITLGSVLGGVAGACIWNTSKISGVAFVGIGSVLCSIIGGVTAYYLMSSKDSNKNHDVVRESLTPEVVYSLDINVLIETIEGICLGLDNCISVFRDTLRTCEQNIHESSKKDLVRDYSYLVQSLSDLFVQSQKNECPALSDSISDVFKSLQNYHIQFKLYSTDNREDFIETESEHVSESVTTKPALYKDGVLVESGECLIPIVRNNI